MLVCHFQSILLLKAFSLNVRDLISVKDVQEDEELVLGPNGALVFCMEYLMNELDWLHEQMNETEDDYFLIDCPGQIELYSHLPVMRQFCDKLQSWGFNVCTVFLLDSQFLLDADKFISGVLTTLSTMVALETPAVSVLSKMDLLNDKDKEFLEMAMEGNAMQILETVGLEIFVTQFPFSARVDSMGSEASQIE